MRAIGASNMSLARLKARSPLAKGSALPRYETLQPNYNLYDRVDFENQAAPICTARGGIGVITDHSLAFANLDVQIPLGRGGRRRKILSAAARLRGYRHPRASAS